MSANRPKSPIGTVFWEEEPKRTRIVKRACHVCRAPFSIDHVQIVSPQGVAHESSGVLDGMTDCGKDATVRDWWWRT